MESSFPNDPTAIWSETYVRLGALVGLLFFVAALLMLWRSAIRAWGPFVGGMGALIPVALLAAVVGVFAGLLWPVAMFMPIALLLARPSSGHAGRVPQSGPQRR